MIKMFKDEQDKTKYWEISFCEENKHFVIHYGTIGGEDSSYTEQKGFFTTVNGHMKALAKEQLQKGYQYISDDVLKELVIHIPLDNTTYSKENTLKSNAISKAVAELLSETQNGVCDAEDSRASSMNIYCSVLDINTAVKTITEKLEKLKLLDGVMIGHLIEGAQYVSDYPEKGITINLS